jgi:hypothetical protein
MTTRLSVTLEDQDETIVREFTDQGSPARAALLEWVEDHGMASTDVKSDAALLRILLRVGAEALRSRVLDVGYSALAVSYTAEDHDESRRARARYADRTDTITVR